MTHEERKTHYRGIAARLWCEPQHAHKEMDVEFAESIAAALEQAAQPVWTTGVPKAPGAYWFQNYQAGFAPDVYTLSQPNGPDTEELAVDNMDGQPLDEFLADYGPGEWAGPIQLPREAI